MDEKILKWLFDIKLAIDEIDGYFDYQEIITLNTVKI